jgi:hypothetical protein
VVSVQSAHRDKLYLARDAIEAGSVIHEKQVFRHRGLDEVQERASRGTNGIQRKVATRPGFQTIDQAHEAHEGRVLAHCTSRMTATSRTACTKALATHSTRASNGSRGWSDIPSSQVATMVSSPPRGR